MTSDGRLTLRAITLPALPAVALALLLAALAAGPGWFGPGGVVLGAWTYVVGTELHRLLPPTFYESRRRLVGYLACQFVLWATLLGLAALWRAVAAGEASLSSLTGASGQPLLLAGYAAFAAAVVASAVCNALVVRHLLSALKTVESGHPARASIGLALLSVFFLPIYVVSTHLRARLVLLNRGVDSGGAV